MQEQAFSKFDHAMMARAIALAEQGRCVATPNPFVGCVIAKQQRIIGEGFTQLGGRPHAEAMALKNCTESPEGATVYCTLEPCMPHAHSRGPACAELLVEARVARVVSALQDPHPVVDGAGHARLMRAGIQVENGLLADQVRMQLKAFMARITRGRPWVTLKIAMSLDGKTALANGESQWITGEAARREVHAMRAAACAVLTGCGTVRRDNPQLNVRHVSCDRQPQRVVIDNRLEIPDEAALLHGEPAMLVTSTGSAAREQALRARGIEVLRIDTAPDKNRVDLMKVMRALAARGMNAVMVEAGSRLNAALLQAGVVDELVIFVAPSILGDPARGVFALPEIQSLAERTQLKFTDLRRIGDDVCLHAEII